MTLSEIFYSILKTGTSHVKDESCTFTEFIFKYTDLLDEFYSSSFTPSLTCNNKKRYEELLYNEMFDQWTRKKNLQL